MSNTEAACLLDDLVSALRALGLHRAVDALERDDWNTVDAELAFLAHDVRRAIGCNL